MYKISRLLNELSVILSREYLTGGQKADLVFHYYWMKIRYMFSGRDVHEVRFMGFNFYVPSFINFVGIVREVFVFGDYYFKATTSSPVIIDCGANIGTTTIFFKWLYPQARITAFEPSPIAVAALRKNIELNALTDIDVVEAAASNSEEPISFWEQPNKSGGSTAVRDVFETKANTAKFEEVSVKSIMLSTYVTGPVDLLKMDIEGGEGIVIQDLATHDSLKHIKTIILEFHESEENKSNDLPTLLSTLKKSGYKLVIYASEITPSSEKMMKRSGHHFLIRATR